MRVRGEEGDMVIESHRSTTHWLWGGRNVQRSFIPSGFNFGIKVNQKEDPQTVAGVTLEGKSQFLHGQRHMYFPTETGNETERGGCDRAWGEGKFRNVKGSFCPDRKTRTWSLWLYLSNPKGFLIKKNWKEFECLRVIHFILGWGTQPNTQGHLTEKEKNNRKIMHKQ